MNPDANTLPDLTRRQEEILALIVESYTHTPEPVSSKYLGEQYNLGVSPATIRNEMAALEDKGYISAPHTSAGRVPTEQGYRYFVKRLLKTSDLSRVEQTRITEKLQESPLATEQWMYLAAAALARTVPSAALVTAPVSETSRFKHVELISIQGRLVLMVLVLHSGSVHQQMLNLAESLPQTTLSEVAQRINDLCLNLTANEVRMRSVQLQLLEREVAELAADQMDKADTNQVRSIYREGLSGIISAFQGSEGAQQAVRVFEERAVLNAILSEVLANHEPEVRVFIAGEGRWEELNHLTMVLSRYGIPGQVSGALGVIGPTHLNYSRAITTVRYVSRLMTDMLTKLFEEPPVDVGKPPKSLSG
jgi:heat-inducible transcriptional repressor